MNHHHLYTPEFPSPLNPHRAARRRPKDVQVRRHVSVSPTERLLRYKATEAWRSHVLLLEAREYERLLMEKIASRERNAIRACPSRKETLELQSLRYGLHTSLERAEERIINEHVEYVEEEQGGMDFQLNIPDLSSFALRRVALALGLMRRLPIAGWLRCETPAP